MDLSRDRDTGRDLMAMRADAGAPRRVQWVRFGTQWRTASQEAVSLYRCLAQSRTEPRQHNAAYPLGIVPDPAVTVSAIAVTLILSVGHVLAAGRHTAYAGGLPPRMQTMPPGRTESQWRRPHRAAGPLARVVP